MRYSSPAKLPGHLLGGLTLMVLSLAATPKALAQG
jgi:hypothetical protein